MSNTLKNGNGKYDIIKVLQFVVPFALLALLGWLLVGGYVQTPESRHACIKEVVHDEIGTHEVQGHMDVRQQITHIEGDVREIKSDVKEQGRVLTRIEAKLENGGR